MIQRQTTAVLSKDIRGDSKLTQGWASDISGPMLENKVKTGTKVQGLEGQAVHSIAAQGRDDVEEGAQKAGERWPVTRLEC